MGRKSNTKEDIWKKIDKKSRDECWEWRGSKDGKGYGEIQINGKLHRSHRIVYELTYGSIPNDLCVLHSCDNPLCCNPKHLWLGTINDNNQDMYKKGRYAIGEMQGSSKLTVKDVLEIRKKYFEGNHTQERLGKEYNVSHQNISNIINLKYWKHL